MTLATFGCSKTDSSSPGPAGAKTAFETLFPHIDTAVLSSDWGRRQGYATITSDGKLTIAPADSMVGGSYVIQLTDSSYGPGRKTFNLLRAGVDTVISRDNGIGIDSTPLGRKYYWMLISGSNLPIKAIVRGVFVDSI